MELLNQPGCYVWNPYPQPGETVTWTGECSGGLARGTGTLTWESDDNQQTSTGSLQDGELNGQWVIRNANGTVWEGPFVAGERNGQWVIRRANGNVLEGPYVADERNGQWVIRFADGDVWEGPYVAGEPHGDWVIRYADGYTRVRRYENGALRR